MTAMTAVGTKPELFDCWLMVVLSGRTRATVQYRPQPRRLFAMITSVTASNTNWMLLVSVAHVW